jgi:DNA adenine methylase
MEGSRAHQVAKSRSRQFGQLLPRLRRFLYVDPPYAPLSATANFTSYTAAGFSDRDQAFLPELVIDVARRGCHVLVSNSTAPEIAALYKNHHETRAAGLQTFRVPALPAINSIAARRGAIDEYLIANVAAAASRPGI